MLKFGYFILAVGLANLFTALVVPFEPYLFLNVVIASILIPIGIYEINKNK